MNRIHPAKCQSTSVPAPSGEPCLVAPARPQPPSGLLFLCVANSARSQLAEGLARAMAPAGTYIASAGSAPRSVHPLAIQVLREVGIDISFHRSKGITDVDIGKVDTVVTLCAEETCSVPLVQAQLHWPIADPASATGLEAERIAAFRLARDQIQGKLRGLFAS